MSMTQSQTFLSTVKQNHFPKGIVIMSLLFFIIVSSKCISQIAVVCCCLVTKSCPTQDGKAMPGYRKVLKVEDNYKFSKKDIFLCLIPFIMLAVIILFHRTSYSWAIYAQFSTFFHITLFDINLLS